MGNRIIDIQRGVRELGRLRTGYKGPKGNPVRSKTWIITTKERDLVEAAAAEWGGEVKAWTPNGSSLQQWSLTTETDRLPAFLPPGDPINQANEMWSRGGVTRRCDGVIDQKSGQPCVCKARFGDEWFRRGVDEVCRPYTNLNVMLLGLPDIGMWRHTTKSYYAAMEITGMVDLIKARIGVEPVVPVWLIIDQRQKVADGRTTPYPVPVIKVRGAGESAAELLSGNVPTLELGPAPQQRAAIGAAPAAPEPAQMPVGEPAAPAQPTGPTKAQLLRLVKDAPTVPAVRALWESAGDAMDDELAAAMTARAKALSNPQQPAAAEAAPAQPAADAEEPVVADAEEPDPDALWSQINAAAGKLKWSANDLEGRIVGRFNKTSDEINGWQMQDFLADMKAGTVQ